MKANIVLSSYEVFGSGSASASLHVVTKNASRRVTAKTTANYDNGFIGYRGGEVNLYPKTKIIYRKSSSPGGTFQFEGTWENFLQEIQNRKFDPKTLRGILVE